ncbi:uncharacterized protein EV422DRAFT_171786 [Fimicolochytrium jonesii]|uniref:uncharacterized protein n=1 Tax=Fimicolochytrium jonesii TaxID=1396493 RepID=UPI0022FDC28A|nr:uncharacterized protein EV422DRAFT_171786 [Fimicolochytrium jonesii]KAI8818556.1 hypothetical protein EV422DRAFT_171786 [Fimicolochytrium jonesii]
MSVSPDNTVLKSGLDRGLARVQALFLRCRALLFPDAQSRFLAPSKHKRKIFVNIPIPPEEVHCASPTDFTTHFQGNEIRSAKYTPLTFIPRNLLEQFRRLANVYFLLMVIMQAMPQFSIASPILAAMPLIVIMGITGIKDGFEDWKRHQSDNEINNLKTLTLANWQNVHSIHDKAGWLDRFRSRSYDTSQTIVQKQQDVGVLPTADIVNVAEDGWAKTAWRNLKVGDFVMLKSDDRVPADILILSTSDFNNISFVETKSLDGETNLKCCEALKGLPRMNTAEECRNFKTIIESEPPTLNLYSFSGTLLWRRKDASGLKPDDQHYLPINIQNVLLRGSILRNTEWIIGMVLFTGKDSKVVLNAGLTPSKRSLIEKQMNPQVALNFLLLIVMCIIIAVMDSNYASKWSSTVSKEIPWVLTKKHAATALYTFFTSMIMLQNVVPISLYITIEGVKTLQAYFIHSDVDMYHEEIDKPCVPRAWNLSDDLGQIEYIFSDKTGTLTQNKMEYIRCSIAGTVYGEGYTDVTADNEGIDLKTRAERTVEMGVQMKANLKKVWDNPFLSEELTFLDKQICQDFLEDPEKRNNIEMFFTLLAVCHTVLSPKVPIDLANPHSVIYNAQSPDEQALVAGAKDFGIVYQSRTQDSITILVHGKPFTFKVLNVIEFTSTRKRMSVIVQAVEEPHTIYLFSKGADSVIYERLAPGQIAVEKTTLGHLETFANEGLRTLVLAYRILSPAEFSAWNARWQQAACALHNRDTELENVAELIEVNLTLIGATAIEDKLQDDVPECVSLLRQAGIKLWVLTGDKLETAINISFAANLLSEDQTLLVLRAHSASTIMQQLRETYAELQAGKHEVAMIIDGESLRHALASDEARALLLEVGTRCVTVVCCRVSPKQKAEVVRLVKHGKRAMCAAIGDGANDVSMIQEANIGIGISGLEGLQAVLAADYAFGQFRFLSKLVLVHGRWSYYRTSEMIFNFFYKNMTWVFALFWYQIFCGFSGRILYDYTYLMFFNLIFTSLPCMVLGIFDQDVDAKNAVSIPPLYAPGIKRTLFTIKRFVFTVISALYQSAVCFFIPYIAMPPEWSTLQLGSLVALCVIVTVNLGVVCSVKHWTWIVFAVVILSIGSFVVYVPIYAVFPKSQAAGTLLGTYGNPAFWACLFLTVVVSLGPRFACGAYQSMKAHPSDLQIIRERQNQQLGVPPRVVRVGKNEEVMLVEENLVGRRVSLMKSKSSLSLAIADSAIASPTGKPTSPHGPQSPVLSKVLSTTFSMHSKPPTEILLEEPEGEQTAEWGEQMQRSKSDTYVPQQNSFTASTVVQPHVPGARPARPISSEAKGSTVHFAPSTYKSSEGFDTIEDGDSAAPHPVRTNRFSNRSAPVQRLTLNTTSHTLLPGAGGGVSPYTPVLTGRTSLHFLDSGAVSTNTGFAFAFDDHPHASMMHTRSPSVDAREDGASSSTGSLPRVPRHASMDELRTKPKGFR